MNTKEAFAKIQTLLMNFGLEQAAPVVATTEPVAALEVLFVDYPLADGTVLSVDKLEVNGNATLDGALAEGIFTLADGTIVTAMGGVIVEVETAEAEAVEVAAPMVSQEAFNAFKAETAKTLSDLKKQVEASVEISKEQFSVVQLMAVEPAAEPLEKLKGWEKMTQFEKYKASK